MNLLAQNLFELKKTLLGLSTVMLTVFVLTSCLYAQTERNKNQKTTENPLIGVWESDEATVEIRKDGTLTINGEKYRYKIKDKIITVSDDEGSMDIPFQVSGNRMTVTVEGRRIVYTRVSDKAGEDDEERASGGGSEGRVAMELVGKWCYMSNLTGSNSRMSNRCFTLYENGTYEYYAETSSSGAVASSASQESDSGRWSVSGRTIIAYSNTHGRIAYPFEKRNHPKTGDPMIVLDGDAYVTAYRKNPW
jgi:hypothetical protein